MNDLRFALRQLARNPGFTIVSILTLALGIGVNTALFSVINGVLLRPLPFPEHERLVTLWESGQAKGAEQLLVSPPTFMDWLAQNQSFEALGYWTGPTDYNLVTADGSEKVQASYVSSAAFGMLRTTPVLGRLFTPEEDQSQGPRVAVISHGMWQEKYGGNSNVLGMTLTVDTYGQRSYVIIGVMPVDFGFPGKTDLWLAAGWNGLPLNRRLGHWLNVLARLKPGVTLGAASAEMNVIQARVAQANPRSAVGSRVAIVPLLQQTVGRTMQTTLFVLWGVVALVLLIACANVANLMLARAASRQREIALRLALGAGRSRVIRQLLAESLFLALVAGGFGTLLGFWGLRLIVAASPANIPRLSEVSLDATALWFTLGISVITGLIFGMAPAWQCSRPDLNSTLKEGSRAASTGVTSGTTRSLLVVAEVALATVLLVGAGLMLQSFARLLSTERGFRSEQLVTAELDFSVAGFTTWIQSTATRPQVRLREIMERLRQVPGVHTVAAANDLPRRDNRPALQPFQIFGHEPVPEGLRPTADEHAVSPDYFRTLGIRLLRGREFTEADTLQSPGVTLVNEAFARRFFPNEDPVGKFVSVESNPGPLGSTNRWGQTSWNEIVGLATDVKSLTAQPEAMPLMYRPYWQWPMQRPILYVRASGDLASIATAIRRETRAAAAGLPAPRIRSMTDRVKESIAQPRFQADLLSLFAFLALSLAACGIYGVLAYSVSQRRREIGVRIALGAQRRNVVALVFRQGLRLVAVGVVLGALGAFGLTRVLRALLYEVRPTDPLTFACVPLVLLAIGVLACWWPARTAARTDLIEALRTD